MQTEALKRAYFAIVFVKKYVMLLTVKHKEIRMTLPNRSAVAAVLNARGRGASVYAAINRAWDSATNKYPERVRWKRKSAFRGLVWEEAVQELLQVCQDDHSITPVFHQDTASFILDGTVLFRFKHANLGLATANYPTPEAMAFDDHDVDLYGFSGLQRVELCYVLNEFETSVVWIGVAARSNGKFMWKIELAADGVAQDFVEPTLFGAEHGFAEDDFDPMRIASFRQGKSDDDQDVSKKDNGSS